MKIYHILGIYFALHQLCYAAGNDLKTAPVSGFALSFISEKPIANATITVLETGEKFYSDTKGHFGPIQYPVGQAITLELQKSGFKTTQSGTVIVPKDGLTSPYNLISFQVPSTIAYHVLAKIVGAKEDENSCHVTTTITKYHQTLHDIPQGEPGAQLTITPFVNSTPFYFGIFKGKILKNKTNPFPRNLVATSEDGGAAYFNLPPRTEPYTISAIKKGVVFSRSQFICRKGAFINISPPRGPMVLPKKPT